LPRDTPEGCYIPVYAQTADGLVSNVVTLPLPRGRTLCKAPEAWPRPAARIGTLVLSRFSIWFDAEPGEHEAAEAIFADPAGAPLIMPLHLLPPPGMCTGMSGVYEPGSASAVLTGFALDGPGIRGVDAGSEIEIAGPEDRLNLVAGAQGFYRA